jgi:hypothetical protein
MHSCICSVTGVCTLADKATHSYICSVTSVCIYSVYKHVAPTFSDTRYLKNLSSKFQSTRRLAKYSHNSTLSQLHNEQRKTFATLHRRRHNPSNPCQDSRMADDCPISQDSLRLSNKSISQDDVCGVLQVLGCFSSHTQILTLIFLRMLRLVRSLQTLGSRASVKALYRFWPAPHNLRIYKLGVSKYC